jgi:succinoglycan biosynthesis protein ExoM
MTPIAVCGSFVTDLVVRVERHPRPGETLFGKSFDTWLGGKGFNQALAARRLGADVAMVGCLGEDAYGDAFLASLDAEGIRREHVHRSPGGTGVAVPIVDDHAQNTIVVVPRANLALTEADVARAAPALAAARALLLQLEVPVAACLAAAAIARNAGVAACSGDAIAFLDDDQELAPGWLLAVAQALVDLPHDAFFGAVEPLFETPARATGMTRQLFSRRHDRPRGAELIAFGPDKTRAIALATNNSIFRRAALPSDGRLFDPAFGNGGGEDYDLICRMQRAGRRFAWLPEARAREFVPESRCDASYLRRRFFAGGQAYAAAVANASAHPRLSRWAIRAKAVVQLALLVARMPIAFARGGDALADHLHVLAGARGKLSLSALRPIYREAPCTAR